MWLWGNSSDILGKFAQRFAKEGLIFVRQQSELKDIKYSNLTVVEDKNGKVLGFMATTKNETTNSCYPVHLSSFILGWSRVYMSRILRNMKATIDPELSPIYSDTDSYIIPKRAFDNMPKKRIGSKLGQLKSEVSGPIIYLCALAPKTYNFIFVDSTTLEIKTRTRCKGIPHTGEDYNAFEDYIVDEPEEAIQHFEAHLNDEDLTGANIRERNYFVWNGEEVSVHSLIPSKLFPRLLKKEVIMELLFGAMERQLDYSNIERIRIAPTYKKRTLYKTPWWESGKRIYKENAGEFDYAYAPGHQVLDELFIA